jgi:hypothetical protein
VITVRPTTAAEAVARALAFAGTAGATVTYQLENGGGGGRDPWAPTPTPTGRLDCSGFACWASGYPRHIADFAEYDGDINVDSAIMDADRKRSYFAEVAAGQAQPGDWVVYPSRDRGHPGGLVGHVAVIVAVPQGWQLDRNGQGYTALRVVQCAAFHGRAIRETDGAFWDGLDHGGHPKASRILRPTRYVAAAPAAHEMTAALLAGALPALDEIHGGDGDAAARQRALMAIAAWAARRP